MAFLQEQGAFMGIPLREKVLATLLKLILIGSTAILVYQFLSIPPQGAVPELSPHS